MIGWLLNRGAQKRGLIPEDIRPVGAAAFAVIDTELTGLNGFKDSIVSFGAVRMSGGRISLGDPFYRLVKPKAALTRDSVIIHGIMPSDVAGESDIRPVMAEFARFCGSDILVGHYVEIDLEFISREMKRIDGSHLINKAVDTAKLYRWMVDRRVMERHFSKAPEKPDLYLLASCFGIPVSEVHNALTDAFITAQLFQQFLPLLEEEGIKTVDELLRIGDPGEGSDRFRSIGEIGNL